MSRDGVSTPKRGGTGEDGALRRLSKREIDQRITAIVLEVAQAFEHVECERIEYLGEELFPRPIDNRRFIRIMSRHLVFN